MKRLKRLFALIGALCCAISLCAGALAAPKTITVDAEAFSVTESGAYDTLEEVAIYLSLYGKLPGNYLTRQQADAIGWDSRSGNLWKIAPGRSIGGDWFGNYEEVLPDACGRTWHECDIGYSGGYRNGQRLVFSSDGLLFYTEDHYNTFCQIRILHLPADAVWPNQVTSGDEK